MSNIIDQATYEKALKRAHDEGCTIIGYSEINGSRAWSVQNPKHGPYGSYTVRQERGANHMECNCDAGHAGTYCKHRALVREARLEAVAARSKIADEGAIGQGRLNWYATVAAMKRSPSPAQRQVDEDDDCASDAIAERRNEAWFEERGRGPSMDEQIEEDRERWLESL